MQTQDLLSKRIKEIKESASMSANEKAVVLKMKGFDIINLSIGQPDFPTLENIKNEGICAIKENFTGYTPSRGISELLASIGNKFLREDKLVVNPKNIIVTPGTKQALFYLNMSIINPGDEAIIFEPYWVTYIDSLALCGGMPVTVVGTEENGFKPRIEDVEKKITKRTKYILFSNPSNPAGALWSKKELNDILALAKKHDILVVVDEIYEHITFDNASFVSMLSLKGADERTVLLNGFSKGPSMTGWRIGYAVAPGPIIEAMDKMQQQTATCASSISQKAAVVAYEHGEEIEKRRRIYEERRKVLVDGLNKVKGFHCQNPKGTFYVFPNISGLGMKSVAAAEFLLEKAGVNTVPGIAFGESFDDYLRISFAVDSEEIKKALRKLTACCGTK